METLAKCKNGFSVVAVVLSIVIWRQITLQPDQNIHACHRLSRCHGLLSIWVVTKAVDLEFSYPVIACVILAYNEVDLF